jgi:CelD/BcsL family acetyltransferase involved in cellulose biosynthesis
VLRLNGEPLAAQLWLTCSGKANIYKLAYVKGMEKLSVGSVLTQALMQHAMDVDRVAEVDYLSGDDAYKADWMALRRERVGLEAFDLRSPGGLLAAARHVAAARWHQYRRKP